ncbi:hypothetical protein GCM10009630_26550 [Kribbella jejuensis]|uniref:Uncharacterized protein n=1 Tax=Kribbella jejuensis TaxID=236068 RepID=A0A542DUL8_9ACTN|nr:hypothetical protein [Kribbella jejuensis]TQJ06787.1 hypothetical protein FB475_6463 [Kribbella jejuensis]
MSGWQNVREFTLGNVERPATRTRNHIEWGPNAIRVASGSKDDRVLTPYAYVGPDRSLYLDADLTQLLCRVSQSSDHAWSVRDAEDHEVGTITRIPSGRPLLRPNWRITQPGHPELIGRTEWLSGPPTRLAAKAAGRLLIGVLDGLTGIGDEGGDQPTKTRTLEWRSADRVAMYSEGTTSITVHADWLDRRLAFAYCLLAK